MLGFASATRSGDQARRAEPISTSDDGSGTETICKSLYEDIPVAVAGKIRRGDYRKGERAAREAVELHESAPVA